MEFRALTFQTIETITQNSKIVINLHKEVITHLLPALVKKIESEARDVRFLSLKIFTDFIIQYLNDEKIYS